MSCQWYQEGQNLRTRNYVTLFIKCSIILQKQANLNMTFNKNIDTVQIPSFFDELIQYQSSHRSSLQKVIICKN